jgi:hypothetical protein
LARYKRKRKYRRYATTRRRAYKVARKKKTKRRKSKSMLGKYGALIGAGIYGAARGRVSSYIDPILTSKLGALGGYADEAAMIGVNWAVGKFFPAARPVTKAGMMIEAARVGEKMASGSGFSIAGNSAASW